MDIWAGGRADKQIFLHTEETLVPMREACILARDMLDLCCAMAQPGVTTDDIDAACHAAIVEAGACPSPLNYHGFPKVSLVSRTSACEEGACKYSYGYAMMIWVILTGWLTVTLRVGRGDGLSQLLDRSLMITHGSIRKLSMSLQ